MKAIVAPLALILLTAGCARDDGSYPSLGHRAVEDRGFAEPKVPVAVATPDPALDAKIADITARLAAAAKDFDADAKVAEPRARAAKGAAAGSEAWLSAQESLATLDDRRARTSGLVGEIDDLAAARAAALQPAYPALDALRAKAQAEVERQNSAADRLQSSVAPA
ncbi:hypothetical protein GGQ80_000972 [Sphingomonas jinjuensis]|uniref:Uncharacterized protein n=1 Tax=Sphingomonas jinjuensis TaxID=535907 RepID=A0A840FBD1_9SPHN|nr:hypothetical protein [Sphingomonas jinjuensis]MBB4153084.1 hypothetical protein [Sphingomonas jinjuensis]